MWPKNAARATKSALKIQGKAEVEDGSDQKVPEHQLKFVLVPDGDPAISGFQVMAFFNPKDGSAPFTKKEQDNFNSIETMLDRLRSIHLVYPSQAQGYRHSCLSSSPHGGMAPDQVPSVLEKVAKENQRRDGREDALVLIEVPPGQTFRDEHLTVYYVPIESFKSLPLQQPLQELTSISCSNRRNNRRTDLGVCNWNNSNRERAASLGIAKPAVHKATRDKHHQRLLIALEALLEEFAPGFTDSYNDPDRQREFSNHNIDGSGNKTKIEAASWALTLPEEILWIHLDRNNEKSKDYPGYIPVYTLVFFCLEIFSGTIYRVALIVYGKKSAGEHMRKVKLYHPWLKQAIATYNRMPERDKVVGPDTFVAPNQREGMFIPQVHLQKGLYYYPFAEVMGRLFTKFPQWMNDPRYLAALVYCAQVSNHPQHFWQECDCLLRETTLLDGHPMGWYSDQPLKFCIALYEHMWKAKSGEKSWEYPTKPRHQPCHNRRCNEKELETAINVILLMLWFLWQNNGVLMKHDPVYYHSRACKRISQPCPDNRVVTDPAELVDVGLPQCGEFSAGHILGVLAYCNAIPQPMHDNARIAITTKTYKRMKEFGIKKQEELDEVLKCLKVYLKISKVESEELCCATGKGLASSRNARGQWVAPISKLGFNDKQGRAKLLHRDGQVTCPPSLLPEEVRGDLLLSLGAGKILCPSDVERYFTVHYTDLPNLRRKQRKASTLLPVLSDQVAVFGDKRNLKIKVVAQQRILQERPVRLLDRSCLVNQRTVIASMSGTVITEKGDLLLDLNRPGNFCEGCDLMSLVPGAKYYSFMVCLPPIPNEHGPTVCAKPDADFPLRKNYPTSTGSIVIDWERLFLSLEEARDFAMFGVMLEYRERFTQSIFGRSLLSHPEPEMNSAVNQPWPMEGYEDPSDRAKEGAQIIGVTKRRGLFNTAITVFSVPHARRLPRFVRVNNNKDGIINYITNDTGTVVGGLMVVPCDPVIDREGSIDCASGMTLHGTCRLTGVLIDQTIPGTPRRVVNNCTVSSTPTRHEVMCSWSDGATSWEPLSNLTTKAAHHLRRYGLSRGYQNKSGWKRLTTGRGSSFDGYPIITGVYDDARKPPPPPPTKKPPSKKQPSKKRKRPFPKQRNSFKRKCKW